LADSLVGDHPRGEMTRRRVGEVPCQAGRRRRDRAAIRTELGTGCAAFTDDQGQVLQAGGRRLGLQAVVAVGRQVGALHDGLRCGGCIDAFEVCEGGGHRSAFSGGAN